MQFLNDVNATMKSRHILWKDKPLWLYWDASRFARRLTQKSVVIGAGYWTIPKKHYKFFKEMERRLIAQGRLKGPLV